MNAVEQAKGLEYATKIAAIVNLFKSQFPDARADLKPWVNDPDTQELVDPDSIDIGFHLPGWSRKFQCRSILVQIRLYKDPSDETERAIGVEAAGFGHQGLVWRLFTVKDWQLVGEHEPAPDVQEKLKYFCREALSIF